MEAQSNKRKYKSELIWTELAEQLLVNLWEDKTDMQRGERKNPHFYEEMAADLARQHFCCTAEDVREKIHSITKKYKQEKARIDVSGGGSEWRLFPGVHRLLGTFKIHNWKMLESIETTSDAPTTAAPAPPSQLVICESITLSESPASEYSTTSSPSDEISSTPSARCPKKKKKGNNFQQELLKRFESLERALVQQSQQLAALDAKFLEIEKRKVVAMEKSADAAGRLANAFVEYLQKLSSGI